MLCYIIYYIILIYNIEFFYIFFLYILSFYNTKGNNKYLKDYDKNKESSYLKYIIVISQKCCL